MRSLVIAVAVIAAALTAFAPTALAEPTEIRIAWWNDLFSELPPADDSGFTNDFELEVWCGRFGGRLYYRIITEQVGSGDFAIPTLRSDQLDLFATARERRRWRGFDLDGRLRAGPTITGNLGGLAIQDGWHRLTRGGPTTDHGLQDTYEGDDRIGAVAGAWLSIDRAVGPLIAGVAVDGQLALGTGVTSGAALARASVEIGPPRSHLILSAELGVAEYAAGDPNLELSGGYGAGGSALLFRLAIGLRHQGTRFGFQFRANESGSGEPMGLFWLELGLGSGEPR